MHGEAGVDGYSGGDGDDTIFNSDRAFPLPPPAPERVDGGKGTDTAEEADGDELVRIEGRRALI